MRNLSTAWKQKVKYDHDIVYLKYIDFTLKDGTTLSVDNSDLWNNGFKYEQSVSTSDSFDIGSAIINSATVTLNNFEDKFTEYDFEDARAVCYIGLEVPSDISAIITDKSERLITDEDAVIVAQTSDDTIVEKIRICTMTLTEAPYQNTVIINLAMEDYMRKFDRDYSESKLSYPATRSQIIRDACDICGVTLQTTTFDMDDYIIPTRPNDESLTFRQVVSWVAMIGCQWARCDEYGRLCLGWYASIDGGIVENSLIKIDDSGDIYVVDKNGQSGTFDYGDSIISIADGNITYSGGDVYITESTDLSEYSDNVNVVSDTFTFTPNLAPVVITGVRVIEYAENSGESEETAGAYLSGTEGYVIEISDNELIRVGYGAEIAKMIGEKCIGMKFAPFTASCLTDVAIEAGDPVIIPDFKGKRYTSYVTTTTLQPGAQQQIACEAKSAPRNALTQYSQMTKIVTDFKKNIEAERTAREKALEELSTRISESSGLYTTTDVQEDGSNIYYLHDKPLLSDSSMVWKMTAEAWGVSTDGGKTWNAGMTVDGDVIANILTANGINASWINTGELVVREDGKPDGKTLLSINVKTGELYMNADYMTIGDSTLSGAIASSKNMTMLLSNEYQAISVDSGGNYTSFPTCKTTLQVLYGTTDITSNCSYTVSVSSGVTGSWDESTKTYTVSGLTADNGYVQFKATYAHYALSISKTFTISKLYGGASGVTYSVETNTSAITRTGTSTYEPSMFTFALYRKVGDSARESIKGRFKVVAKDDSGTETTIYTSAQDENAFSCSLNALKKDYASFTCTTYEAGGTTTVLDVTTISVIEGATTLTQDDIFNMLTNNSEWQGLYKDSDGNMYISFSYAKGGTLKLGNAKDKSDGVLNVLDASGNVIQEITADGTKYYNASGDLIQKTTPNGTFFFDSNGYPTAAITKYGFLAIESYDSSTGEYNGISIGMTGFYKDSSNVYYGGITGVRGVWTDPQSNDIYDYTYDGNHKTNDAGIRFKGGRTPIMYTPQIYNPDFKTSVVFGNDAGVSMYGGLSVCGSDCKFNVGLKNTSTGKVTYGSSKFYGKDLFYNLTHYVSSAGLCLGGSGDEDGALLCYNPSSSLRYKYIGDDISEDDIEAWFNISPVWARYKEGYLADDDPKCGKEMPMFIAEDVEKYFPIAVDYKDGLVENWNERIVIPAMFAMIKSQKKKIDDLTEVVNELVSRLSALEEKINERS